MSTTKPISAVQSVVTDLLAELHAKRRLRQDRPDSRIFRHDPLRDRRRNTAGTSETEIRSLLSEPPHRRTRARPRLRRRQQFRLGNFPDALPREALSLGAAHRPRRLRRARPGRHSLRRSLRHEHARRPARLETLFLHRPRIARRLAAHRAGAGIRESLPPHQTSGQSRRRIGRGSAIQRARTRAASARRRPSGARHRRGPRRSLRRRPD